MDDKCNSLLTWFRLLEPDAHHSSLSDLTDGVAMSQVLSQIDPVFFSPSWGEKIKTNVENNWRLKVSNLKKVIERVTDYCTDVLNLNVHDYAKPDALRIAEGGDVEELARLLQLILGCAVNCENKETYITQIMGLEEACQRNIMCAIQELEAMTPIRVKRSKSPTNDVGLINDKIRLLVEERDILAQRCHDLDRQVSCLTDEKLSLVNDLQKLQSQYKCSDTAPLVADGQSLGPAEEGSTRYNEMRRQLDMYKEEIFKIETAREDLKLKSEEQEKQISIYKNKIEELQGGAMEICRLKDEVDALRETNALLKSYESTVQSYKKKLEDHGDLRRQLKILEDKNLEYMQQNIELEETAKKQMALKTQIEVYKKQLAHANEKLETEISKSDRLEFEIVGLNTKISVLQREKETLLSERDLLKETCEELQYGACVKTDALADTVSKELISPTTKRLMDSDSKILKEEGDHAAMQVLLDESNVRIDHLRCQLREANQKILELQSLVQGNQLEVDGKLKHSDELDKDKSQRLEESFSQMVAYRQKISTLQETLSQKDAEISAAEEKYRRCIEKAKQVIRSIDPKYGNYLGANANTAKMSSIEMETRIIVSAFHRLGLVCHREVLDQRFAQISQSQSFLSRQRQPICRKSIENYRNK